MTTVVYGTSASGNCHKVRMVLDITGEYRRPDTDDNHVDGKGAQQGVQIAGLDNPMQGRHIDDEAENQGQDHHQEQPQVGIDSHIGEEVVDAEHPQGHGGAVGQVDHPHHSPD